jgi:hypothetical protein
LVRRDRHAELNLQQGGLVMKTVLNILAGLLFAIAFGSSAHAGIKDGLVAYYPFDGSAIDASLGGKDGSAYGGIKYVDGVIGQAVSFDGVDDHIELGTWFNYQNFSISVWIKSDKEQEIQAIIDNNHNSYVSWAIHQINASYYGRNGNFNGPSDINPWYVNFDISLNEWQHLVFMVESGVWTVYRNGQLVGTLFRNNDIPYDGNQHLGLARWWGTTNEGQTIMQRFWEGSMDELRIYNRTLSDAESELLFLKGQIARAESSCGPKK